MGKVVVPRWRDGGALGLGAGEIPSCSCSDAKSGVVSSSSQARFEAVKSTSWPGCTSADCVV
jgi:hypothetical protein